MINSDDDVSVSIGYFQNSLVISMLVLNCSIMLYGQGQLIYRCVKRSIKQRITKLKQQKTQEQSQKNLPFSTVALQEQTPQKRNQKQVQAKSKEFKKKQKPDTLRQKIKKGTLDVIPEEIEEESDQSQRVNNKEIKESKQKFEIISEIKKSKAIDLAKLASNIPSVQSDAEFMKLMNMQQQEYLELAEKKKAKQDQVKAKSSKLTKQEQLALERYKEIAEVARKERELFWQGLLKKREQKAKNLIQFEQGGKEEAKEIVISKAIKPQDIFIPEIELVKASRDIPVKKLRNINEK